jgi:hypothetical protein
VEEIPQSIVLEVGNNKPDAQRSGSARNVSRTPAHKEKHGSDVDSDIATEDDEPPEDDVDDGVVER